MKKIITVLAALLMFPVLSAAAFADLIAPVFTDYDVVVVNPDGAETENGEIIPCGTVLSVRGEYEENGVTILTCYYKDGGEGRTASVYVNAADVKEITEETETETGKETTRAPETETETVPGTTEQTSAEASEEAGTHTVAAWEMESEEYSNAEVTNAMAKESTTAKASSSANKIIVLCVTVSAVIAIMAAGTVIYVKKKRS